MRKVRVVGAAVQSEKLKDLPAFGPRASVVATQPGGGLRGRSKFFSQPLQDIIGSRSEAFPPALNRGGLHTAELGQLFNGMALKTDPADGHLFNMGHYPRVGEDKAGNQGMGFTATGTDDSLNPEDNAVEGGFSRVCAVLDI